MLAAFLRGDHDVVSSAREAEKCNWTQLLQRQGMATAQVKFPRTESTKPLFLKLSSLPLVPLIGRT